MYVLSGDFEFTVNGITSIFSNGDTIVIPSNTPHRGKALTDCKIIFLFGNFLPRFTIQNLEKDVL